MTPLKHFQQKLNIVTFINLQESGCASITGTKLQGQQKTKHTHSPTQSTLVTFSQWCLALNKCTLCILLYNN